MFVLRTLGTSCIGMLVAAGSGCWASSEAGSPARNADAQVDAASPYPEWEPPSDCDSRTAPDGVAVRGQVFDAEQYEGRMMAPPAEGIRVSLYGHDDVPCVFTDAEGRYELRGVPPNARVIVEQWELHRVPVARPIETVNGDLDLATPSYMAKPWEFPGEFDVETELGTLIFSALEAGSPTSGVGVSILPKRGLGPFVALPSDEIVEGAETRGGWLGWYRELPPGDYTITFGGAGWSCEKKGQPPYGMGYAVAGRPNAVEVPVIPGHDTATAYIKCARVDQ